MTSTQRMYDVFRVTRGGVTMTAVNVNREEAILNMSLVLAAYNSNWQLQPENPRGMVRVLNTISNDYHIIAMVETDDSINRREGNTAERTTPRWLVQVAPVIPSVYDRDYLVNADLTPTDDLVTDRWRDSADGRDSQQEAGV